MASHKLINIAPPQDLLQKKLSRELGISPVLAQVLINRGLKDVKTAAEFLDPGIEGFLDPFQFSDMAKAVKRVRKGIARRERIMVFGDYDVDGVTATALLKNTLTRLGADVVHYLPHRVREGYGLNKAAVEWAHKMKVGLLITVDCGTSCAAEVKALNQFGIDTIITDHHESSGASFPDALAMINPKLAGSGYGYRELAGVGVAYKLCQALASDPLKEDLDLVCLGTIADVVPLTGENRIIAREGLKAIAGTKKLGLRSLMEVSGISRKKIDSTFVGYILGPRINASGRMDSAETALKLLLSPDKAEAQELAKRLDSYNRERQKIEAQIILEAGDIISRQVNFKEHKVIVVAKEGWHQGVLGIVASKLTDRFYRPTILISINDGMCKGSGRSIKNFHLFHTLVDCREMLGSFGGHAHAVGLLIREDKIEDFRNKINAIAADRLRLEDLIPSVDIDLELALGELTPELVSELDRLEPFGTGNPEPLFYTRALKLKGQAQVLGRETLKFWVTDGEKIMQAIGFGMASLKESLEKCSAFELVYRPEIDTWNDGNSLILEVKDIILR